MTNLAIKMRNRVWKGHHSIPATVTWFIITVAAEALESPDFSPAQRKYWMRLIRKRAQQR
jgi:hypothetical protein